MVYSQFPLPACKPCNIWASHDADISCHKPRRRCHPHKSRTSDIPGGASEGMISISMEYV